MINIDILDEMEEVIYLADIETYELLFINKAGKNILGIKENDNFKDKKCYEVLQGKSEQCEFCTNKYLKYNSFYEWEIQNKILNKYFKLKDKLIDFNNRKARLEIAIDITDMKEEQKYLINRVEYEKFSKNILVRLHEKENNLEDILKAVGKFLNNDRVYVFEIDALTGFLNNTYAWCRESSLSQIENLKDIGVHLIDRWIPEFNENGIMILDDIEKIKETHREEYEILKAQQIENLITSPLYRDGKLYGFIGTDNMQNSEASISIFKMLGYIISLIIEKKHYQDIAKRMYEKDRLTGVYNRNKFIEKIENIKKSCLSSIGIVYIDINGLKDTNDKFGHEYGDQLIVETATNLSALWNDYNVFRNGGDEFVIVAENIDRSTFDCLINKTIHTFNRECNVKIAIGYDWKNNKIDIEQILMNADFNMYEDKKNYYRNNLILDGGEKINKKREELLSEVKRAIRDNEFSILYQPKFNIKSMQIVGAEALIRWIKPIQVFIYPDSFIPDLEENQAIYIIDYFVLEHTIAQIYEWINAGCEPLPISINISKSTLLLPNFIKRLKEILNVFDIPKKYLEIEITERECLGKDLNDLCKVIEVIRKLGIKVSIDDFGTGESNILLISSMDIDTIKIAKSTIDYIGANDKVCGILKGIKNMMDMNEIGIIVEGIETEEQYKTLLACGYEYAQGYYFSKPVSKEILEQKYLQRIVDLK